MGCLPDEIWTEVLKSGVERRVLDYRDLCIVALVCRRLRRLSSLDSLWHLACQNDFGNPEGEAAAAADAVVLVPAAVSATLAPVKRRVARNCKLLYSARFEKIRNAKLAARRRQILRVESHLAVLEKQAKQFHARFLDERSKLSQTVAELKNLEHRRYSLFPYIRISASSFIHSHGLYGHTMLCLFCKNLLRCRPDAATTGKNQTSSLHVP
jgi:hypothetical protein